MMIHINKQTNTNLQAVNDGLFAVVEVQHSHSATWHQHTPQLTQRLVGMHVEVEGLGV